VVIEEARKADGAPSCDDADHECAAAFRQVRQAQLRDEARAEASYQAKPAWQKLLGWLALPAIGWLLWHLAGRRPAPRVAATRSTNHPGKT
jgi:hypothetical protein